MELVVGASAARQRLTSRLECRQRAQSLLSCQTWTGFHQHQFLLLSKWFKIYLFSYRAIKTFGIKPPPPLEKEGVATLILTTLPFQWCDLSVQEKVDLPNNYTQDILYKGLKEAVPKH